MNAIERIWTPEEVALCAKAEAHETDRWAAAALFDVEIFTPFILDPCCGRGILGHEALMAGYSCIIETDLHNWGVGFTGHDFLAADEVYPYSVLRDGSVVMNAPFTKACEFVEAALRRGARKVACFQRWAWWAESRKRRAFWDRFPVTRIWACGDRATCFPITMPEHERRFLTTGERRGSSKVAHAWFVWERGAPPGTSIGKIWDRRKDKPTV